MHESGLSVIHVLWRVLLFVWVVESRCRSVRSGAETALVHLILLVHQHYTVVLLMAVACFERPINGASDGATSIREFASRLFVGLVQGIRSTVSCGLAATAYGSVVATRGIAVSAIAAGEVTNVHGCIHGIHIGEVAWTSLDRSLSIMVDINSRIHVLVVSISLNRHTVFMLDWVAGTTVLPLLAELGLGNGLELVVAIG